MGGVVNTVAKVADNVMSGMNKVADFIEKPLKKVPILKEIGKSSEALRKSGTNVVEGIKDGKDAGEIIGASAAPIVARGKGLAGSVGVSSGLKSAEVPNIADSIETIDPAVEAEAARKERVRTKRQAEIDILTDKPGRGGTILTDNYKYNV